MKNNQVLYCDHLASADRWALEQAGVPYCIHEGIDPFHQLMLDEVEETYRNSIHWQVPTSFYKIMFPPDTKVSISSKGIWQGVYPHQIHLGNEFHVFFQFPNLLEMQYLMREIRNLKKEGEHTYLDFTRTLVASTPERSLWVTSQNHDQTWYNRYLQHAEEIV